jgi:acyl-coenzyme A thioesterase PaaI-like protein
MLGEIRAHMPGGGAVLPDSGSAAILRARLWRRVFNLFPAFRDTGARVEYVDPKMREVRVRLPLDWRTRNLVGTIFGGSMYAAVDRFYALMLMQSLGPDYVVWDKAAAIRYRRPGRTTLALRPVHARRRRDTWYPRGARRRRYQRAWLGGPGIPGGAHRRGG